MDISTMRSYIRSVVDIDSSDISDDTLNRFLGEGYDLIVYAEKRWPFYEVVTTFNTVVEYQRVGFTVVVVFLGGFGSLVRDPWFCSNDLCPWVREPYSFRCWCR